MADTLHAKFAVPFYDALLRWCPFMAQLALAHPGTLTHQVVLVTFLGLFLVLAEKALVTLCAFIGWSTFVAELAVFGQRANSEKLVLVAKLFSFCWSFSVYS